MPQIDFSNIQIPSGPGSSGQQVAQSFGLPDNPAAIRDMLLSNPHEVAILKERNPPLAEALLSGNIGKFFFAPPRRVNEVCSNCIDLTYFQ